MKKRRLALFLTILILVPVFNVYAANTQVTHYPQTGIPPLYIAFIAFILGAICILAFFGVRHKQARLEYAYQLSLKRKAKLDSFVRAKKKD